MCSGFKRVCGPQDLISLRDLQLSTCESLCSLHNGRLVQLTNFLCSRTRTLHLEVKLQDISLMIQGILNSNLSESHVILASLRAMQEQLLLSLHGLHQAQNQVQGTLSSLRNTVDCQRLNTARSSLTHLNTQAVAQRTRTSNSTVLSPDSQNHSSGIVGIAMQQVEKSECQRSCSCRCHTQGQWRSHPILRHLIGSLLLGYSRTPQVIPDCDKPSCQRHQRIIANVFYVFPQWFIKWVLVIAISYAKRNGMGINLRAGRMRSSADVAWTYVGHGDLTMVQYLFKKGEASPFDIAESGLSMLHVCSTSVEGRSKTEFVIALH